MPYKVKAHKMVLPRPNTRVRSVFDTLCKYPSGTVWSDLKSAYDNTTPRLYEHSRKYSGLELSRLIHKFCIKTGVVGKRIYKLKPEWAEVALKNPFYCQANKDVDKGKLEMCAGGSVNDFAGHKVELKLRQDVEDNVPIKKVEFKAGDWVMETSKNEYIDHAFEANGIKRGATYQVESVNSGFVHLSGCTGGWFPEHFTLVTRPPEKVKGSPEMEDMAWGKKFDDGYDAKVDIERPPQATPPFTHVSNAEVSELKAKNDWLRNELQTFRIELGNAEKNANEYKDQASEWQDASNEWETKYRELVCNVESWRRSIGDITSELQMMEEVSVRSILEVTENAVGVLTSIDAEIQEAL